MKSEGVFRAIEFEADVCDGMIHIPSEYRQLFREGERVRIVILYADSRVPDGVKGELEGNRLISCQKEVKL